MTEQKNKLNKSEAFVEYIIARCKQNKGIAAALRRADNPDTEYQSWDVLAAFKIDLEKPWERMPFALIAAAIAKAKVAHNGDTEIGRAIANCYDDGSESDQAKAKLRRLLACDSIPELCRILRPLLSLIDSKSNTLLDYAALLEQLIKFKWQEQRVKAHWAQDFYRRTAGDTESIQITENVA